MSKRVLITGGSGFVGANLARRALDDGHDVHLLLRRGHSPWRLRGIAERARIHEASMDDPAAVRDVVHGAKPDWVFHLAAYGAYSNQTGIQRMLATNVSGWIALVDASVEAGVDAIVNAGSSSEYGFKRAAPDEETVVEPNSDYAVTKAAATHYGQLVARTKDVRVVTMRLYSIYGPFEEPTRLMPTLLTHAMAGTWPPLVAPDTARDFVYVDDGVDALMLAASAPRVPPAAVYNVCTSVQTRLRDLVELVRKKFDVAAAPEWGSMPGRSWDTDVWTGSNARIARELGWAPQVTLSDGLDRMAAWMRARSDRGDA